MFRERGERRLFMPRLSEEAHSCGEGEARPTCTSKWETPKAKEMESPWGRDGMCVHGEGLHQGVVVAQRDRAREME